MQQKLLKELLKGLAKRDKSLGILLSFSQIWKS
jgi:hypothetical protein